MANYTKKALKGSLIIFVFFITTQLIAYLVRLLFARKLTTLEFGLFYACYGFISFFVIFKEFGLNEALTKFIPEFVFKKDYSSIKNSIVYAFSIQFLSTSLIALAIFFLSGYLSDFYFHNKLALIILRILLVSFLFESVVVVLKNTFLGYQKHAFYASVMFLRMFFILILSLIFFRFDFKVFSPVFAYTVTPFVLILIFVIVLFKKVFPDFSKIQITYDKKLLKNLVYYGVPVMIGVSGLNFLSYTDTLVLTYYSIRDVALYNVVLPTASILTYLAIAISNTMFPLVSELWTKKFIVALKKGIELVYRVVFLVVFPLALTLFMFPSIIIRVLFGQKFLEPEITVFGKSFIAVTLALQILMIGVIFLIIFIINNNIINGMGKPKVNAKIVYLAASLNLILNLALIPKFGIIGAAVSTTIGNIIMAVMTLKFLKGFLDISLPLVSWMKTLFLGMVFTLIIYGLKGLLIIPNPLVELILIVFIAGIFYVIFLFLFKLIKISEVKELIRRFRIKDA